MTRRILHTRTEVLAFTCTVAMLLALLASTVAYAAGSTTRVSVSSSGTQANSASGGGA